MPHVSRNPVECRHQHDVESLPTRIRHQRVKPGRRALLPEIPLSSYSLTTSKPRLDANSRRSRVGTQHAGRGC